MTPSRMLPLPSSSLSSSGGRKIVATLCGRYCRTTGLASSSSVVGGCAGGIGSVGSVLSVLSAACVAAAATALDDATGPWGSATDTSASKTSCESSSSPFPAFAKKSRSGLGVGTTQQQQPSVNLQQRVREDGSTTLAHMNSLYSLTIAPALTLGFSILLGVHLI